MTIPDQQMAEILQLEKPYDMANMKGPGMSMGSQGMGKAVYFADPDGHPLEIKTY